MILYTCFTFLHLTTNIPIRFKTPQSHTHSIFYFLSIYVIFVMSGLQVFYPESTPNKKSCLHIFSKFVWILHNHITWSNHVIIHLFTISIPPSWCNLVLSFISWLFYNFKKLHTQQISQPIQKNHIQTFYCNSLRVLYHPIEPLFKSFNQSQRARWACRYPKPS